jgi:proteasome lid subunit RPN8/RPN11
MDAVSVTREVLERLLEEARRDPLRECCGLLGGREGAITTVLPATNALASPTAYEIAPDELFKLFRHMREAGLEHLGIYHSHPNGENAPSPRDIELAYYPDAAHFVLSPRADVARPIRAFTIREGCVRELEIVKKEKDDAEAQRAQRSAEKGRNTKTESS